MEPVEYVLSVYVPEARRCTTQNSERKNYLHGKVRSCLICERIYEELGHWVERTQTPSVSFRQYLLDHFVLASSCLFNASWVSLPPNFHRNSLGCISNLFASQYSPAPVNQRLLVGTLACVHRSDLVSYAIVIEILGVIEWLCSSLTKKDFGLCF